jgi:predicted RNA binding protein YcfA (HicA-like mRNA interferase family)
MPRLRPVSGEQAIRALERLGFRQVRQRGSHVILKRETAQGVVGCVVPLHREPERFEPSFSKPGLRPRSGSRGENRVGGPECAPELR